MEAKDTIIKDELIKVAMSDIKNRWLHSKGRKTTFEYDCFDDIMQTNRFVQADVSFKAGIKLVADWVEEHTTITYGRAPLKIKWQSLNPVMWQAFLKGEK